MTVEMQWSRLHEVALKKHITVIKYISNTDIWRYYYLIIVAS